MRTKIQIYTENRGFKRAFKKIWCGCFWTKIYGEELIERYGMKSSKRKNRYYSPELKEEIINKVLLKRSFTKKCIFRLCSAILLC